MAVQTEDDCTSRDCDVDTPPVVDDIFCPDKDYEQLPVITQPVPPPPRQDDNIPQLDGNTADGEEGQEDETAEEREDEEETEWINPDPATGFWVCRCCYFAHSFTSEENLKEHHDTLSMEYEECNVCYPWHVWI